MKNIHFLLILILSLSISACGVFKSPVEKLNAQLVGTWTLTKTEKVPNYQNPETQREINNIVVAAFDTQYEFLSNGTYIKTTNADQEKGSKAIKESGKRLLLGNAEFEIKEYTENELKLQKSKYLYTFTRKASDK
jgi:hypothetical protein